MSMVKLILQIHYTGIDLEIVMEMYAGIDQEIVMEMYANVLLYCNGMTIRGGGVGK